MWRRMLSAHIISQFVLIKLMKGDEDGQEFCCFLIDFEGCPTACATQLHFILEEADAFDKFTGQGERRNAPLIAS